MMADCAETGILNCCWLEFLKGVPSREEGEPEDIEVLRRAGRVHFEARSGRSAAVMT
jgi:hypothetical protein